MRICFIALGEFRHVDAYLDFFQARGHEVHFVALAPGPKRAVPTYSVGFPSAGKMGYLPAIWRARRVVRGLAPDIVHAHYATSAGLAAVVCGVHPYLVTAHGTDVTLGVRSPLWRRLLTVIFRQADCVNTVSRDLTEMVTDLGIPREQIVQRSLGIDTRVFGFRECPSYERGEPLKLICTRRFEPVYDHATVLEGLALLKARQVPFKATLVGDGPLLSAIKSQAATLGLDDLVAFEGAVENGQLPALLARHQVYLSSSTRDGTSLCLLEALATGVYPVVSDIRANSDWIQHGSNGLLHQVSNPQSLADCIALLLREPERLRESARHNRELVLERADRRASMEHLEEVYRELAGRRPRGGSIPSTQVFLGVRPCRGRGTMRGR